MVNALSVEASYQICTCGKTRANAATIIAYLRGASEYIGSHIETTPPGRSRSRTNRKYSSE